MKLAPLPPARDERLTVRLSLETLTPIFGGAAKTRSVDEVDIIRTSAIRGQLRMWWRALQRELAGPALYREEASIWGGVSRSGSDCEGPRVGRSPVELRVCVVEKSEAEATVVGKGQEARGYAMFPFLGTRDRPVVPHRKAGVRFTLELRMPRALEREVLGAVKAWLSFGGYGGRTRRGLGALGVSEERERWLPERGSSPTAMIEALLGPDVLAPGVRDQTPRLMGARVHLGSPTSKPELAWATAVGWLLRFRQGTEGPMPAREGGATRERPGRSNWPEADKVRRLHQSGRGLAWAHPPRHDEEPAWPRAGFGLPIIGQFQGRTRGDSAKRWEKLDPPRTEPPGFQLRWCDAAGKLRERLASPLIVKPLALADGSFCPLALWLGRAAPAGEVVLCDKSGRPVPGGAAPFDRLHGREETPCHEALRGYDDLASALFAWLEHPGVTQ